MLNIGDRIFIAKYGAGVVKKIESISYLDNEEEYVNIFLFFDKMNLLIPSSKINNYKIRRITERNNLKKELKIINSNPENIEKNWSKRYRRNREKIYGNNLKKICEVLRDLYYLKKNSLLPQGEEKILERVEGILASEVMMSLDITYKEAYEKIRNIQEEIRNNDE